jgi:hypothetical protein
VVQRHGLAPLVGSLRSGRPACDLATFRNAGVRVTVPVAEHLVAGTVQRDTCEGPAQRPREMRQLHAFRRGGLDPNPYAVESRRRRATTNLAPGLSGGFVKIQRRMVFLDPAHSVIAALQGA